MVQTFRSIPIQHNTLRDAVFFKLKLRKAGEGTADSRPHVTGPPWAKFLFVCLFVCFAFVSFVLFRFGCHPSHCHKHYKKVFRVVGTSQNKRGAPSARFPKFFDKKDLGKKILIQKTTFLSVLSNKCTALSLTTYLPTNLK